MQLIIETEAAREKPVRICDTASDVAHTLRFQGFSQLPPAFFEPPVVYIIRVLVISLFFTRHVSQAYTWIVGNWCHPLT